MATYRIVMQQTGIGCAHSYNRDAILEMNYQSRITIQLTRHNNKNMKRTTKEFPLILKNKIFILNDKCRNIC